VLRNTAENLLNAIRSFSTGALNLKLSEASYKCPKLAKNHMQSPKTPGIILTMLEGSKSY